MSEMNGSVGAVIILLFETAFEQSMHRTYGIIRHMQGLYRASS